MEFYDYIDSQRDALIRRLQGCIQIPSVYREDDSGYPYGQPLHDCLTYMLDTAREMGFRVHNMDEQVGWCEYGEGDEMVAVLGHLDVVPEGDGWTVPPYEGRVADGKIYGRGTMDDKGPTMAALFALKAIKESGLPLKRRVRILFGLNEETGSADMKYYNAHGGEAPVMGITPDGEYPLINGEKGLITEFFGRTWKQERDIRVEEIRGGTAHNIVPDKAYAVLACAPETADKIVAMSEEKISCTRTETGVRVEAAGVNAHGGTPYEGENAIGRLMLFLAKLPLQGDVAQVVEMLSAKLGMEWDGASLGVAMADELSGPFTMNLGMIQGDASGLEVRTSYRYPVTKKFDDCGPAVQAAFAAAGFAQTHFIHKAAIYMPPESELVQKLLKVYSDYTGDHSGPKSIGGGTYAKMIPNTLAFGPIFPGDEVREHKPDEYMELDRLVDNAKILANAIYELAK